MIRHEKDNNAKQVNSSSQAKRWFCDATCHVRASCARGQVSTVLAVELRAEKTELAPGQEIRIDATVVGSLVGNSSLETQVDFEVDSAAVGTIKFPRGPWTIFVAKGSDTEVSTAVIRGTSFIDKTKSSTLTLSVVPNVIKGIAVTAARNYVEPDGSIEVTAVVSGLGTFSQNVKWEVLTGGGILSSTEGQKVELSALGLKEGGQIELRVSSRAKPNISAVLSLKVMKKPLPTIVSFEAKPLGVVAPNGLGIGGGKVRLSWEATDAESLEIQPGVGAVLGSSVEVVIDRSTSFVLTVRNSSGKTTQLAQVNVENQGILDVLSQIEVKAGANFFLGEDQVQALGSDGTLYVAGRRLKPMGASNEYQVFVTAYDRGGNSIWEQTLDVKIVGPPPSVYAILANTRGDVYIAGTISGNFTRPSTRAHAFEMRESINFSRNSWLKAAFLEA